MQIWHPAPRGLIQAAAVEHWTKEKPAPDLVVYLWVYSQRDCGESPTRRQVARLFGWTEHRSRKMLARVAADHSAWLKATSPTLRTGNRPPKANQINNIAAQVTHISPKIHHNSPDRAREFTPHHKQNTETDRSCLEEMREWQALKP